MSIFDCKIMDAKGKETTLAEYKGKVILIINSATECGFTPHYEGLQKMYEEYKDKGFVILDFPCNQFGHQAPGTEDEIALFCSSRYGVTFPMFGKIEVNGDNASALFTYLKEQKGFEGFDPKSERGEFMDNMLKKMDPDYASKSDIKWNFTKFLIDREGNVVCRFEPTVDISLVEEKVKEVLEQ